MKEHLKNIIKKTIGATLIIIGVTGLVLPVLPGIILILAGLFLIDGPIYERMKKKINDWMRKRKKKK